MLAAHGLRSDEDSCSSEQAMEVPMADLFMPAIKAFDDECTHEQCSLAVVPVKVYRTRVEGDTLHIEV